MEEVLDFNKFRCDVPSSEPSRTFTTVYKSFWIQF